MGFLDTAMYAKISALCLLLAMLLFLISFADPHWASTNSQVSTRHEYIGLWRSCTTPMGGSQTCRNFIDYTTGDWLKACQGFMTLGFFGLLGCISVVFVAAFVAEFEGEPKIMATSITVTAITSLLLLMGVSIWGGRYTEYFDTHEGLVSGSGQLDWAFGVAVASLIVTAASCVLMVMETVLSRH